MNHVDDNCFFLDVTITDNCNFRCDYCFEMDYFTNKTLKDEDLLIEKIHELLVSDWFISKYKYLQISYWGGEPMLNFPLVRKIFKEFKDSAHVRFFMYTNGTNAKELIEMIEDVNSTFVGGMPKFLTQISYDGEPINSLTRKTTGGKSSTTMILDAYRLFVDAGLPITLKSTIKPSMFKYLYEAYLDFTSVTQDIDFFPTIDYHGSEDEPEKVEEYLSDLKTALFKIAQIEKKRIKETGKSRFHWFNQSRAICSAGANMSCVSTEGSLYKCHGCTYEGACKEEHKVTTLKHPNWIDSLAYSSKLHEDHLHEEPDMCKDCPATFCIRCNSAKYSLSKKENYFDKWNDYTNQSALCSFYQLNGKIVRAIYALNKE